MRTLEAVDPQLVADERAMRNCAKASCLPPLPMPRATTTLTRAPLTTPS